MYIVTHLLYREEDVSHHESKKDKKKDKKKMDRTSNGFHAAAMSGFSKPDGREYYFKVLILLIVLRP